MSRKSDPEILAIRRIVTALLTLDPSARARVIRWLADRYAAEHTEGAQPE